MVSVICRFRCLGFYFSSLSFSFFFFFPPLFSFVLVGGHNRVEIDKPNHLMKWLWFCCSKVNVLKVDKPSESRGDLLNKETLNDMNVAAWLLKQ